MTGNSKGHRFVFVGGMHRSGTSALYRLLGTDPRVSIFRDTGVIEDEGQYLQSIYPVEAELGGVAAFGLNPNAHWTEHHPAVAAAKSCLATQWSRHWDLSKPILVEKTPSNLLRARFLQEIFPESAFLFVMRHPVAAVAALRKWTSAGTPLAQLFENWLSSHETLYSDLPHLRNFAIIKYEDLVANRAACEESFNKVLKIRGEFDWEIIQPGHNTRYFDNWREWRSGEYQIWTPPGHWKSNAKKLLTRFNFRLIEARYEKRIRKFGYSFVDITR